MSVLRHSLKARPLNEDAALDESPGDVQYDDVTSVVEGTPNAEVALDVERALNVERASGVEGALQGEEVVSVVEVPSGVKDTLEAIRTSGDGCTLAVDRTLGVDAGRTLALEGTFDVERSYDVGGTSGFESTFVVLQDTRDREGKSAVESTLDVESALDVESTLDVEGTFVAEDNRGVDPIAVCLWLYGVNRTVSSSLEQRRALSVSPAPRDPTRLATSPTTSLTSDVVVRDRARCFARRRFLFGCVESTVDAVRLVPSSLGSSDDTSGLNIAEINAD